MYYGQALITLMKIQEQKAFEELCAKFPEAENKLRADRKAEQELQAQRDHELEVAREGRTKVIVNNYGYW